VVWLLAGFGKENTVNVNAYTTSPDPDAGSVEAQVARIIEQAQAEGLHLTGVMALAKVRLTAGLPNKE